MYVQPKANTQKIRILNICINWEHLCPNLSVTVENKICSLLKIRLFTFQTSHNELDIPLPQFESLSKNWEKYVFDWEELNFEHIAEILTLGKGPLIS